MLTKAGPTKQRAPDDHTPQDRSTLAILLAASPADREAMVLAMDERERREWQWHWPVWAREAQLAPAGDWRTWLIMAGRGFGKTRAGAEWVRSVAERDPDARIALVASSLVEARAIMVDGDSGLRRIGPPERQPRFESSLRRLTWPNGAQATLYSAAEPEALRGPQHSHACGAGAKGSVRQRGARDPRRDRSRRRRRTDRDPARNAGRWNSMVGGKQSHRRLGRPAGGHRTPPGRAMAVCHTEGRHVVAGSLHRTEPPAGGRAMAIPRCSGSTCRGNRGRQRSPRHARCAGERPQGGWRIPALTGTISEKNSLRRT